MNKAEIITCYNWFLSLNDIGASDFVIGAGGACVMLGIRDITEDMDMEIPALEFEKFKQLNLYKLHLFGDIEVLSWSSEIDLHVGSGGDTVIIDGVTCYTPERLLTQKLMLNRDKDQKDILALRDLLSAGLIV